MHIDVRVNADSIEEGRAALGEINVVVKQILKKYTREQIENKNSTEVVHPFLIKVSNAIEEGNRHSPNIDFSSICYNALIPILDYLKEIEERLVKLELS